MTKLCHVNSVTQTETTQTETTQPFAGLSVTAHAWLPLPFYDNFFSTSFPGLFSDTLPLIVEFLRGG